MEIFIVMKMSELHVTTQVNLGNIMNREKQVLESIQSTIPVF